MKTPEEIKKGLEYLSSKCFVKMVDMWKEGIAYDCAEDAAADALAYTQQLESNDSQVKKALSDNGFASLEAFLQAYNQVKKERDAAISDIGTLAEQQLNPCDVCKHLEPCDKPCERALQMDECFEWRGLCEENSVTPPKIEKEAP